MNASPTLRRASMASIASLPLLAFFALLASGCDLFEPKDPGERVYRRLCSSCHGLDGRGNTARYMSNEWADLTDSSWKEYGDDGSIERIVREGIFGKMPAHDEISGEEMRALLGYLHQLRREASE
jgi:mono/diheme cytochrome c family protein